MVDIPSYEGKYAVTRNGDIWSYPKKGKYTPYHKGKWLKKTNDRGYLYVGLRKDGKTKKIAVHRIVCCAYLPKEDGRHHCNHKNGIKDDNRVENLEWCTPKENCIHAWATGLSNTSDKTRLLSKKKMIKWNNSEEGKRHSSLNGKARRKLDGETVKQIRRRSKNGESAYRISKDFPVSKQTILKIVRNETYKEY